MLPLFELNVMLLEAIAEGIEGEPQESGCLPLYTLSPPKGLEK